MIKKFARALVRVVLAFAPFFLVYGLPVTLLKANGVTVGAIPTVILAGAAMWLSAFLIKKYNYRCAEKDSRAIKNFTEINKD